VWVLALTFSVKRKSEEQVTLGWIELYLYNFVCLKIYEQFRAKIDCHKQLL